MIKRSEALKALKSTIFLLRNSYFLYNGDGQSHLYENRTNFVSQLN